MNMKKIKEIWKFKNKIFEGLINYFIRRPSVEMTASIRYSICLTCPLIDHTGESCIVPGTAPCCSFCGCKLALKTRSLSSECPHPDGPKWKAEMTDEEQDAYYSKINYNPDKE